MSGSRVVVGSCGYSRDAGGMRSLSVKLGNASDEQL